MSFEEEIRQSFKIKKAFSNYNLVIAFLPFFMDNKINSGISFYQAFDYLINRLPIKATTKQLSSVMSLIKDRHNARYDLDMQNFEDLAVYLFSAKSNLMLESQRALKTIHETEKFLASLNEEEFNLFIRTSLGVSDIDAIQQYRLMLKRGVIPATLTLSQNPGVLWDRLVAKRTENKKVVKSGNGGLTTKPQRVRIVDTSVEKGADNVRENEDRTPSKEPVLEEEAVSETFIIANDVVEESQKGQNDGVEAVDPEGYARNQTISPTPQGEKKEKDPEVIKTLVRLSESAEQRDIENKKIFKDLRSTGSLSKQDLKLSHLMKSGRSNDV